MQDRAVKAKTMKGSRMDKTGGMTGIRPTGRLVEGMIVVNG